MSCPGCCACEVFTVGTRKLCWCPGDEEPSYDNLADFEGDTNSCQEFNACNSVGLACYAEANADFVCKMGSIFTVTPPLWANNARCLIVHWFDLRVPRHYGTETPNPLIHLDGTSVAEVRLLNRGSGYRTAPTVTFEGGAHDELKEDASGSHEPTQATAHAIIDTNPDSPTFTALLSIVLDTPGSVYSSRPTVTVEDPPEDGTATITASVSGGQISGVTIAHDDPPLRNYRRPPHVAFSYGNAKAHAMIDSSDGKLLAIVIDDPGDGYTTPPDVTVTPPPLGIAPVALAKMVDDTERTWEWDQSFPMTGDLNPITGETYTADYRPQDFISSPLLETHPPAEPSATIADVENAYAVCHGCES